MSKKLLAMFLAILMVLGTMPVLSLLSTAKEVKTNIAIGKDTTAGNGGSGANAVDGNTGTYVDISWTNDFSGTQEWNDQCWVTVDLGAVTDIVGIGIANYQSGTRYYHFDVFGSTDNENWTLLCQKNTDEKADATYTYDVTASVRYVKVNGTYDSANGGYHFAEIQVFAMTEVEATTYEIPNSSVTATFDGDTLTFSGTGAIPNFNAVADLPYAAIKAQVKYVVFEEGITSIGKFTCNTFGALESIVIPEGVTHIDYDCFAHSGTITDVYLPTTLTSIAQGAFYSCTVVNVYYDDTSRDFSERCKMGAYNDALLSATWVNDPDWGASGDLNDNVAWAFDAETGTLSITGTGAIPEVASKPWQSFVSQITRVVIGDGITEIPGGGVFAHLDNLDYVETPESLTKIGMDAFGYNGVISYFKLSSNVTTIAQGVLYGSTVTTISCKKDWRAIQQQATIGNYNTAFGEATWVDTEIFGTYFSFGKYGTGMENWTGNGDPRLTQILIATPKWDGEYISDLNDDVWTLTITAADGSETPVTTALAPRSIYDGGTWCILRFVPALSADPAGRFSPTPNKDYKITATITYNGVTETVTSGDTFKFVPKEGDEEPITFNYFNITWQIDGVTEYVEEVPEGFKPDYHGDAKDYVENGVAYKYIIPETVAVTGDATYNITVETADATEGTLGLWGDGYENWPGGTGGTQTQLLLSIYDWTGSPLDAVYNNIGDYSFVITINGKDYTVDASSKYSNEIVRFEPCLWADRFVPTPGNSYQVSLQIYTKADNTRIYHSANEVTIAVADDFEPVVPTPVFASGDINGDGEVTVEDVTALLDYLSGRPAPEQGADLDVDGDLEIQISDVTALLGILAGVGV